MSNQSFAELLSDALDAHGVSPGAAARALKTMGLKIDRGTLIRWRNGENTPSLDKREVISRLPRAIGMSPADEAEFIRAAGEALGFEVRPRRARPRPAAAIPQRIHFGADVLPPFAGRETELALLEERVQDGQSVLITGLGGVGKTRLAQEVLRSSAGRFAHGCEFLALMPGQDSDAIIHNVARLLGVPLPPAGSSVDDRRPALAALRDRLRDAKLLFLIDNVEHADQVRDLIRELPSITWVITARRLSLKRIGVYPVHLELPTTEDAKAIYQAHAAWAAHGPWATHGPWAATGRPAGGESLDARLAADVVEMTGRLPIAIRLLSGLIVNGTVSTAEELRVWMRNGGLLRSGLHGRKMWRFFDQMLESVPPESRMVLEVCGIFATRAIRIANLGGVCRRVGIAATAGALEGLADFSLIDFPNESGIELHPLVHEYARERLRAGPRYGPVREAFKEHYLDAARAISDAASDVGRDYRQMAPMELNLLAAANAFHEAEDWARLRAIWPSLSGYLWNTGNYSGYEALDRQCLDAARATADVDWEAILLSELGFVAMETGAWDEAETFYRQSQALHDAAAGQVLAQARLRRYRAALAMKRGAPDEAAGLLDECGRLLATLSNPPEENLDVARLLFHSATMSVHFLRGDLARAEEAGLAAGRLHAGLLAGGAGNRLGEFRLELGDVQYRLGKRDDACRTWDNLLSSPPPALPLPEHAEARLRLAWLHAQEGAPEQAARLAREARRNFLHHGHIERHAAADDLLARVESGSALPTFDELVAGSSYPGY